MSEAIDLKPTVVQRIMRHSQLPRLLIPSPRKLDHFSTHHRAPYAGRPSHAVRRRIDVTRNDLDGRPVYEVAPKGTGATGGHMLYLHGGGYVMDLIPAVHWPFIARLARTLRRTITVPIYPLAPEHSYRDVFRFLLRVYDRMLTVRPASGVLVAGESAGGSMALALCHALRDAGGQQPGAALLLSPWLDVTFSHPGSDAVARIDPALDIDRLRVAGRHYAGGDPLDTPLVSPGLGEIAGLPPLSIYTGTHDLLNPDTRAFRARAVDAGADVKWHERKRAMHCWMMMPGKHSRTAIDTMRLEFS
jgi:acetyl esterase/lipase